MAHLSRYQIYRLILPPQILDLTSEGLYKGNTLRDLKFETYTRMVTLERFLKIQKTLLELLLIMLIS